MQALLKAGELEPDEEDKANIAKFYAGIQAIFAKDQKEQDAAMGTSPAVKVMRQNAAGPQ